MKRLGEKKVNRIKINILGNGGCLNNGLPYNSFIIDDKILVEAPPDIMLSLKTVGFDVEAVEAVFISHLHGDHTFGLPFLIINKWVKSLEGGTGAPLAVLGPKGIEPYVKTLTECAFTKAHPCYEWLEKNVEFDTIRTDAANPLNALSLTCFRLKHIVETYGFSIENHHETIFSYIADTSWCNQVERILARTPRVIIMDMNGGEPHVHISLDQVIEKGLPLTKDKSIYYGMHLSDEFENDGPNIRCGKQGEEIVIRF